MTQKELFIKAASGILNQGCKSFSETRKNYMDKPMCAYRGINGTKCAVGHLIPDEVYCSSMENYLAGELLSKYDVPWSSEDESLLFRLQNIHDYDDVEQWEDRLQNLSDDNNFQVNVSKLKRVSNEAS